MKRKIFYCLLLLAGSFTLFINGCTKENNADTNTAATGSPISLQTKKFDTVTSLQNRQQDKDTVIWFHHNQYTMVTYEANKDEEPDAEEKNQPSSATCSQNFAGSARAAAKTSFASVSYGTYASINAMRAVLQTDAYMLGLGITNSSPRVSEENRNRNITTSYLYAIARESDNDFHMIIGDANSAAGNLLNCESSGLPPSSQSSYAAINAVRNYLVGYFGTDFCGSSGYRKFTPAIPITLLKGSLFFDIDHAAGTIGPTGLRPNTAWEMHPIHDIAF